MRLNKDIELYFHLVIKERLCSNKGNIRYLMNFIFNGVNFKDKRVLDIGGGYGLFSFYAACKGAEKVICIEPEAAGSNSGVQDIFRKMQTLLNASNVILCTSTFQSYEYDGIPFDIILLHNSINHLDEAACVNLLDNGVSRDTYLSIFSRLFSFSKKGTKLIICDCSRYNLFALLKIRNPFANTIEWHKHQSPEVWSDILRSVGFDKPIIRWSSFNSLRSFGRVLFGNKFMAYLFNSHFCLSMVKK